ncbi:hypothetical protein VIGAN_05005100 [Vigna angularis var. angularis]|uniref:Uncharacterized protein n=1 Tax=Vigna angularis var. angularis TaxID=157739 RepID=A0A0S3S1R1_PHAAN|nr:hypothetical protein VIGAN_05005100 [Vigna angularis var. angularis]
MFVFVFSYCTYFYEHVSNDNKSLILTAKRYNYPDKRHLDVCPQINSYYFLCELYCSADNCCLAMRLGEVEK